jgi:predicted enzyme related to lactoylglutathione lyase
MNSIVHFEIPVNNMDAAKKFYQEAFDWELSDNDMGDGTNYTTATTTPVGENFMPTKPGAINGALIPRDKDFKTPVITVDVDSIDDAIAKVEKAGGKLHVPKGTVPGMGEYAYVTDVAGNVIGLWHSLN